MSHVICDLDGVLWRGQTAIEGAGTSLKAMADHGVSISFATNNSTKAPAAVADKIERLTGYQASPASVFTSSMAAGRLLGPSDGPTLVVGEVGVAEAVGAAGLETTFDPGKARSVVVGLLRTFDYRMMADAANAVRRGARFIATNNDPTFPTVAGLDPGSGAIVASIERASGVEPEVAGKPNQPMIDLLLESGIDDAWVIGDRLDTDIALANKVEAWTSVLVLTGVTTASDRSKNEADHIVTDITAAADLVLGEHHRS